MPTPAYGPGLGGSVFDWCGLFRPLGAAGDGASSGGPTPRKREYDEVGAGDDHLGRDGSVHMKEGSERRATIPDGMTTTAANEKCKREQATPWLEATVLHEAQVWHNSSIAFADVTQTTVPTNDEDFEWIT